MKFLLQTLAIAVLAYLLEIFLPWYSIAIAAFVMGYLFQSKASFLAGFIAIALTWYAKIWMIDTASSSDLADRVAHIFPVQQPLYLMLIALFLGALVGGFASMTGSLLRPRKKVNLYQKKNSY